MIPEPSGNKMALSSVTVFSGVANWSSGNRYEAMPVQVFTLVAQVPVEWTLWLPEDSGNESSSCTLSSVNSFSGDRWSEIVPQSVSVDVDNGDDDSDDDVKLFVLSSVGTKWGGECDPEDDNDEHARSLTSKASLTLVALVVYSHIGEKLLDQV